MSRGISSIRYLPVIAVFAIVLGVWFPSAVSAKPQKGKVFDDWVIGCEAKEKEKEELCFASQTQSAKSTNVVVIRFNVGYIGPKGEPTVVVVLPLGFYLPAGAAFRVDEAPPVPLLVQRCTVGGCFSSAPLPDAKVKELNEG